jgi:hypothetical protein
MTFPHWQKVWLYPILFMIWSAMKPMSILEPVVTPASLPVIQLGIGGTRMENTIIRIGVPLKRLDGKKESLETLH